MNGQHFVLHKRPDSKIGYRLELGLTEMQVGNYQFALELIVKAEEQIKYGRLHHYICTGIIVSDMGDFEAAKQA